MSRHVNIPIFIPHLGCPNQCVFCNQKKISGVERFDPSGVRDEIEKALSTVEADATAEIAFFGGSFTGIDRELMIYLLEIAHSYVLNGRVSSVRCSTRPDYINAEIVDILKRYSVNTVELGLQSASDAVLLTAKRGHGFLEESRAAKIIKSAGLSFVGQMMVGLPGSDLDDEIETANQIISLGADAVRIYPTVVFRDTELYDMQIRGEYRPLDLEDAVARSAILLDIFLKHNVKILRIGLCESENLHSAESYYAGPNHPALGELVENRLFLTRFKRELSNIPDHKARCYEITVKKGALSKAIGQGHINKKTLIAELGLADVIFTESNDLSGYDFSIKERKSRCI